jgi:hypothetical protein
MLDPTALERAFIIHQSSFFAAGTDQQQGSVDLIEAPPATLP